MKRTCCGLGTASFESPLKGGELVQSHDGWSVGLPLPMVARATAFLAADPGVRLLPTAFVRARALAELLWRRHGRASQGLRIVVDLDSKWVGRGMGSSTATMAATYRAVAALVGEHVDPRSMARELASLEPTDVVAEGVRGEGLSLLLWNHALGQARSQRYCVPAAIYVVAVPTRRVLATLDVAIRRPRYSVHERGELQEILRGTLASMALGDAAKLAGFASQSIEINDRFFPKPELPRLRHLRDQGLIHGYFGAHSGTAVGAVLERSASACIVNEVLQALGEGHACVILRQGPGGLEGPQGGPLPELQVLPPGGSLP